MQYVNETILGASVYLQAGNKHALLPTEICYISCTELNIKCT